MKPKTVTILIPMVQLILEGTRRMEQGEMLPAVLITEPSLDPKKFPTLHRTLVRVRKVIYTHGN